MRYSCHCPLPLFGMQLSTGYTIHKLRTTQPQAIFSVAVLLAVNLPLFRSNEHYGELVTTLFNNMLIGLRQNVSTLYDTELQRG